MLGISDFLIILCSQSFTTDFLCSYNFTSQLMNIWQTGLFRTPRNTRFLLKLRKSYRLQLKLHKSSSEPLAADIPMVCLATKGTQISLET